MPLKNFASLVVNKKIAVAVSGGADSTALLFVIKNYGLDVVALTVDHGLRPESKDEAQEIKKICTSLNIEHHTLNWSPSDNINKMQKAARDARYALMIKFCKTHHIKTLFLAHHQDDVLETFFIRMWQKSGLLGLACMSSLTEKDGIMLARPFLNTSKKDLIHYLKKQNIPYIEDPSNTNQKYLRAKARNLDLNKEERDLFLKFVQLIGKLRSHLEQYVLTQFSKFFTWETPCVLKIDPIVMNQPHCIQVILVEKISRLLGFKGFFRSTKTENIIRSLSKKSAITGYSLYWCFAKNAIYVSGENRSCLEDYSLTLNPISDFPSSFELKSLEKNECINFKKSPQINFLFSKTKTLLACISFENLIVFLDEITYHREELRKKGWDLVNLSVKQKPISFIPFSVLIDESGDFL